MPENIESIPDPESGDEHVAQAEPKAVLKEAVPKKTRWFRCVFLFSALIVFILLCTAYVYRTSILKSIGHSLVYSDQPQTVDAIYVLGGGGYVRLEKAIELYRAGYSDTIVIALQKEVEEGAIYRDSINLESLQYQGLLKLRKIPEEHVHWSDEVFYSTYSEAQYFKQWMEKNQHESAIVISGLFQSQRAKWAFDHFFADDRYTILLIPAEGRFVTADDWWTNEEGIVVVDNEIIKGVYYWLRTAFTRPE